MAKKPMTCPSCNAEIRAEHEQVFVFCSYCGARLQTRDIVEVRHMVMPDSLEKMLSDGATYYKLEDYYRAEQKFREVIKRYPEERKGYEELIRTLTRNQTRFPLAHETEVFRLLYEAEQLAPEEEKNIFGEQREKMIEAFEAERARVEQAMKDRPIDVEAQRKNDLLMYKGAALMILLALALLFLIVQFLPPPPITVCGIVAIVWLFYSIWKDTHGDL